MPTERITSRGALVLDRSQPMVDILTSMLRHIGRRDIRALTDWTLADIELDRRDFEVILIEDNLPEADGVSFVSRLRRNEACRNRLTPVIMMAAAPDAARIRAARDAGVTEFLRRPFAAIHLEARLNQIFSAPRPNIATSAYTGPDRRRRSNPAFSGEDRRAAAPEPDAAASPVPESGSGTAA